VTCSLAFMEEEKEESNKHSPVAFDESDGHSEQK
jgi:hypothetical protein